MGRASRAACTVLAVGALLVGGHASAVTDEIQVYTGEIQEPGELALTLHANYVASGRAAAPFPGGIVPDGALNGVAELALGVAPWAELGLYLPVVTVTGDGEVIFDGAKLRALFVTPRAEERRACLGVNLELSYNAPRWDPTTITGELRFILAARLGRFELALNPILDTAFDGVGAMELAPAERVAYRASSRWAVGLEHYAVLGALERLEPLSQQAHYLFAVLDHDGKPARVELGVGFGLTAASDGVVLKLIVTPER